MKVRNFVCCKPLYINQFLLLQKIIIRKFQWRSDGLSKEFRSLNQKTLRAKSDKARRMTIPREIGAFIPGSLHTYPKEAPTWALNERLR